jgi:hypothetical protein
MIGGSHLSVRERERRGVPVWGRKVGRGLDSILGRTVSPRVHFHIFLFFSSFLFLFSYFFHNLFNLIQIDSNQLCKVSKIQDNNPEQ